MPTRNMRWVAPVLAALPGLWLAWQGPRVAGWSPEVIPAAILVVVAVAAIAVGWLVERRLAAWSLPAIGSLLWALSTWAQWFAGTQRSGPAVLLMVAVLSAWLPLSTIGVAAIGVSVRAVCRECRRTRSLGAAALLGLFALVMLAWSCADSASMVDLGTESASALSLPYRPWMLGHLLFWAVSAGLWMAVGLLGASAVGLPLARRYGATAGLLVVSSLPAWLDPFTLYFRLIRARVYDLPGLRLAGSLEAMIALLALGCLVAPAVGVLLARSERARACWLAVPPLLALGAVCVLQGHVRQRLGGAYGPYARLSDGLAVVAFWLPVLMAATLYRRRAELPEGELDGSGAGGFSFPFGPERMP